MINRLGVIVIILFSISCRGNKNELISFKQVIDFTESFNKQVLSNIEYETLVFAVEDSALLNRFSIAYILDAGCSSCIVQFAEFINNSINSHINIPVYYFLAESYMVNIEFISEKTGLQIEENATGVEVKSDFFELNNNIRNGDILLLYENKIIAKILIINNEIQLKSGAKEIVL